MKKLPLLLPLLLLAACEAAEPTAAQVAEKLQAQINELLEEVDASLKEVADLDLDGICADGLACSSIPCFRGPDGGTGGHAASITGRRSSKSVRSGCPKNQTRLRH